jgi:Domain of unknown function (DUF4145)
VKNLSSPPVVISKKSNFAGSKMAINRSEWRNMFDVIPRWHCPTCQVGRLRLDRRTLSKEETGPSKRSREHELWDPEWIVSRFTGFLRCDSPHCRELSAVFGSVLLAHSESELADCFDVRGIYPAPLPFPVGREIPQKVAQAVQAAANLFWMDREAATNKVRQAVEALLTEQRVARFPRKGKRRPLSLGSRIMIYQKKHPDRAELLDALRWLGNMGSHDGDLTRKDVLDGFDLLEHVLDEVYRGTRGRLISTAKKINKNRGPVRQRPRARTISKRPASLPA